jgi:hypothetical protein
VKTTLSGLDAWIVIVLLGVVVILYAFLLPKTAPRKMVDEEVLDSVEGTLQHFIEEMDQENKEFARMVGEMKREHERQTNILLDRIEFLERKTTNLTEELSSGSKSRTRQESVAGEADSTQGATQAIPAESRRHPSPGQPQNQSQPQTLQAPPGRSTVKSRYQEVFEMYDSGKSIEYIAKKLGTNKGEIQLIVQLAKREEQSDAAK